ncbi:MAG: LCP family protein [Nocardioides sp.]
MTTRRRWRYAARLALLLGLAGLTIPDAEVHPATLSLTKIESAKDVDFSDGVVWILALGSDARPGQDVQDGNTDAIQLVGLDTSSGRAAGIGIPRDSWLEIPGFGLNRINAAMSLGGEDLTADVVADLLGVQPNYVLVAGFDGFRDMVDTIGGVQVQSDRAFRDDEFDLDVRKGLNDFDGTQALDYARTRQLPASDFARSANQQQLMLGILEGLLAGEDEEGFMERGTLSALAGLDTNLAPTELYRLAQAVTLIRPDRVETCVLTGDTGTTSGGAQVVFLDEQSVRRIGADVSEDLRFDNGC